MSFRVQSSINAQSYIFNHISSYNISDYVPSSSVSANTNIWSVKDTEIYVHFFIKLQFSSKHTFYLNVSFTNLKISISYFECCPAML